MRVAVSTFAFPGMCPELRACLCFPHPLESGNTTTPPCQKGACKQEQRIDVPQGTEAGGGRHHPRHCQAAAALVLHGAYLVDVDGQSDEDVEEVSKRQASNEDVWPVPHALVLVNDPQEGGVADDPYYEDGAGHNGVDVLEDVSDICGLHAEGQQGWLRAGAAGEAP